MDEERAQAIMKLSRRKKAALILDKRTCLQGSILPDKKSWIEAKEVLEKFYVKFYQQRKCNDREKMCRDTTFHRRKCWLLKKIHNSPPQT